MPAVYAPKHLRKDFDPEFIAANITRWMQKGITSANNANVQAGVPTIDSAHVIDWFGRLSGGQMGTLRVNLTKMGRILAHRECRITLVDAPHISWDMGYYAQVRGRFNPLRPNLSIECGDQWMASNADVRMNTLFHELSHRILGTLDLGADEGYSETQYGVANAKNLATTNPDDALRNAENYGYFISVVNGFTNQDDL